MFKFRRGVALRQSYIFKVMEWSARESAIFKVIGGGSEGCQLCSRLWRGVRSVSHVKGDGRGWGASVMFKVMGGWGGGGARTSSHVQGDGRGSRSVSHVQVDGSRGRGAAAMFKVMGGGQGASAMFKVMGGGEGRQPCSKGWEGGGRQPCSRWWEGVRSVSHVQGDGRGWEAFKMIGLSLLIIIYKYKPGNFSRHVRWGFYHGVLMGFWHKMCPWLLRLLCFWDTQIANTPHSPTVLEISWLLH